MLSLGSIAVMPFLGRAIDRFGAREVACAAAVAVPLLLPIVVESGTYAQLLVAGFVFGTLLGAMDVAMNAYAVAAERASGTSWLSQIHGLWSVGALAGSVTIAASIGAHVALPSLITAVPIAIAIGLAIRIGTRIDAQPVARRDAPRGTLVVLGLLAACGLLVEGAMGDWCALYLRRDLHAAAAVAPLGYAGFAGAMMLARFAGDAVILRAGRGPVLAWSGALATFSLLAALALHDVLAASVAFAFVGVGVANVAPTLFGAAGRIAAAGGLALVTGIGYAAFLIGPAAIGGAAQLYGLRAALGIAVLSAAAVAAAASTPALRRALART